MAGTILSFLLAVAAIIGVVYTYQKLKKTRKELRKSHNKEKKGYDNPGYKKTNAVMSISEEGNKKTINKPAAPKQVWTPQRSLDDF